VVHATYFNVRNRGIRGESESQENEKCGDCEDSGSHFLNLLCVKDWFGLRINIPKYSTKLKLFQGIFLLSLVNNSDF